MNKLGFSVIRENYRPERKDWKLDLRVNEHTELEIFAEENPPKRVNRPEACGLRHLAFCVDSVEQTVNVSAGALNDDAFIMKTIREITSRGNNAEVRQRSNGKLAVYEVKKSISIG